MDIQRPKILEQLDYQQGCTISNDGGQGTDRVAIVIKTSKRVSKEMEIVELDDGLCESSSLGDNMALNRCHLPHKSK